MRQAAAGTPSEASLACRGHGALRGRGPPHHGFREVETPQCETRSGSDLIADEQRMMRGHPTRRPGKDSGSARAEFVVEERSGHLDLLRPLEFRAILPDAEEDDGEFARGPSIDWGVMNRAIRPVGYVAGWGLVDGMDTTFG